MLTSVLGDNVFVFFILQAFSIFFVCVTITSDVACYLLIPVQWLFFTASTYVWVQYIWQTGNKYFAKGRVTILLEFSETWKCQGIRLRLVKVREKAQSQGIYVVRYLIVAVQQNSGNQTGMNCARTVMFMDTFSDRHMTYLYFIRSVIHFSYMMFTENLD